MITLPVRDLPTQNKINKEEGQSLFLVSPVKIVALLWQYYHSELLHNRTVDRNVQHDLHTYHDADW